MSSNKIMDKICIAGILIAVLLTLAFIQGRKLGITVSADEDAEYYEGTEYFTSNDLNASEDTGSGVSIALNGTGGRVKGNGAYFLDGDLVISGGGRYVLSGELTDGSIIVDAYSSSKVWLVLNGVDIRCEDDAAIKVSQADKVFITLVEGTENILSSGEEFSEEAQSDGAGGTVFSHDDLTINGSGALKIEGNYKHGIDANDSLHITGGKLEITAEADGIHVNDEFNITGASLTIKAGDDAVHSDEAIQVLGGVIRMEECYEGFEAPAISMLDGDVTVYPSDDGFNANGGSTGGFGFGFGQDRNAEASKQEAEEDVETYISISGGNLTIVNSTARDADGLDSNGDIYISGGVIRVSMTGSGGNCAIDYASESGGKLVVTGGEIIACGSASMAEGFSEESTQCAALVNLEETVPEGELLTVEDEDGNVILSYEVPCSFNSVDLSSPSFIQGNTYILKAGDVEEKIVFDGITVSAGTSSGFGHGMGPGGMGGNGGFRGMRAGVSGNGMPEEGGFMGGMQPGNPGEEGFGGGMNPGVSGNGMGRRHSGFGGGMKPGISGNGMPEGGGFGGGMKPGVSGNGMPEGGGFGDGMRPDDPGNIDSADASPAGFPGTSLMELGPEVYKNLGIALAALIFGILFAFTFKRRG